MLRADTKCPICSTVLSTDQHQQVLADYTTEGKDCKAQTTVTMQRIAVLVEKQKVARGEQAGLAAKLQHLPGLRKREGLIESEVQQCKAKADRVDELAPEEERLRAILQTRAYASHDHAALLAVQQELAALGYDPSRHTLVQQQVNDLKVAERESAALDAARVELQRAEVALATCDMQLSNLADERMRLQAEQEPLLEAARDLAVVRADVNTQQQTLEGLRREEHILRENLGSLRALIAEGEKRKAERDAIKQVRDGSAQQAGAHKELALIFGKKGVQAMLIENALPELEEVANTMLGRMTDNSTQVQFVTQREGRSGNTIETLDIKIADNMGTRTYEMFSGGEAFRINFAIRIALSKLLARRAGAELSFLLIDEGFGSQDAEGRDRLVEAITSIAEDFQKILVVTHLDELKELFDVHIQVSKGPGGSQISISAA